MAAEHRGAQCRGAAVCAAAAAGGPERGGGLIWLLSLSLLAYAWIILRRLVAWQEMPTSDAPASFIPALRLSVIIPVRNEAANILMLLQDLDRQHYPKELIEVLVVDDHSEDNTVELIHEYVRGSKLNIRMLQLRDYPAMQLKKAAVQKGVELAQGELLVFTDGDCRVGQEWLRQYAYLYRLQQPYFISGPVCFHNTHSLFEKMQLVEFSSLIGIGGASIGMGRPNMCNGANLAYRKDIFDSVAGFAGNEGIASGDDEFLLHKVHEQYPGKVAFLKNSKAIVYTSARKTLISFVSQRVRWASKWKSYQSQRVQLVALAVFLVNFLLFLALALLVFGSLPLWIFVAAYVAKFAVDFLFLRQILGFLGKQEYLWYMLPLQLVYVPYVVITGVWGLLGRYRWKGRIIRNA
ncbi:glycosyltransferase [Pontibacter sp. E15-1]|uniref:glycosyltransferase n=1 Tax=Pontibacter sp. E15-1 TaxID=2919918 RepID=UPI001F4F907E|nr:glycosyltransferase [Pontibacter sp. E15-1]MCJ8163327.1 glycosyltransferase [Pontibacter sp. E15-1]